MYASRYQNAQSSYTPSHGLNASVRPRMKATVGSRLPGGVEMKGSRVFPRATSILRSVMVAGAGTAIWMALSATAASADSNLPDNHSLLGGVSSTVSSVTGTVDSATAQVQKSAGTTVKTVTPKTAPATISIPVPNVPLSAAVKTVIPTNPISVQVPAVTPIVQKAGSPADGIIGTIPLATQLVPADTTGGVVDAVVVPIAGNVDDAAEALVPPVNDLLKPVGLEPVTDVTAPVLQPIVDAVDSVVPPAVTLTPPLPTGDGSVLPGIPARSVTPVSATNPSSDVVGPPSAVAATQAGIQASAPILQPVRASVPGAAGVPPVLSISRVFGSTGGVPLSEVQQSAVHPVAPADLPLDVEEVPAGVAGAGSNSSQNGPPSPAAAFLHDAMIVPVGALPGLSAAGDEQHPEPVCFDPGSSPD